MLWTRSSSLRNRIFHVFDSDFIGNEWLFIAGQKVPELTDEPVPAASQTGASRPAAGRGAPRPPQVYGWEGQRRRQPSEGYHTKHIECLNDIVRHGLGNVVWLSYTCGTLGNPKTAKPTLISSASTGAALSVNGARAFHALIVSLLARSRCILTCG